MVCNFVYLLLDDGSVDLVKKLGWFWILSLFFGWFWILLLFSGCVSLWVSNGQGRADGSGGQTTPWHPDGAKSPPPAHAGAGIEWPPSAGWQDEDYKPTAHFSPHSVTQDTNKQTVGPLI